MRCARVLLAFALLLHVAGTAVHAQEADEPDPFESDGVSGRAKRLRQIDEQVQREAAPNWEEPDPLDEEHDDFDDPDERDDADDDGVPPDPYDDGEGEDDEPPPVLDDEPPARGPKGPLDRAPLDPSPRTGTPPDADD